MRYLKSITAIIIITVFSYCKKNKTSEPTPDNSTPQNTTPVKEGYLLFGSSTYHSNLSASGTTNYTAKQLFWENNNGINTNFSPDSVSLNNFWLVSFSTGQPVSMRTWGPTSVPPFDPYSSMTWHTKATANVPTINETIPGLAYLDITYFPNDQDLSDPEVSVSKSSGFSFIHAPIPATYTKYTFNASLSGVPNSTRKVEKIVNGNSTGVTFTASDISSVLVSPSYTIGSLWIEAYNENVISPQSSTSFTISSVNGINTQVKFF